MGRRPNSNQIAVLAGNTYGRRTRRYLIIAYPVKPGLQAGLLANTTGDNVSHVADVTVVIPACPAVLHSETNGQLAAYLELARAEYRDLLRGTGKAPVIFCEGKMIANNEWREHRNIISQWPKWDWKHLSWSDRFDRHYKRMRWRTPKNPDERRKALQNFRSKCRFVGFRELLPE